MTATQQHLLDVYRAAHHDRPAPPAPGTGDIRLVRELRTWWAFRRIVRNALGTKVFHSPGTNRKGLDVLA
ncbi:hypothetical protein GCM10010218_50940 [Streptomyces mashuensis]|uniref:Uncharacterized protein n=1 Tax=Streptomyces mashuensis TaxID=33904 RepID=A0A919B7M0_9ACTN|nr:hypothetical protein [Streptomyces mashuensis]GHF63184.1 hypothetical protein GCM10010218_50940 [Streptomyces mashuensis]